MTIEERFAPENVIIGTARWSIETHIFGFKRDPISVMQYHLFTNIGRAMRSIREAIETNLISVEAMSDHDLRSTYNTYLTGLGHEMLATHAPEIAKLYDLARVNITLSARKIIASESAYPAAWLRQAADHQYKLLA